LIDALTGIAVAFALVYGLVFILYGREGLETLKAAIFGE